MNKQSGNVVHQFTWGTLDVSAGIINDLSLSPAQSAPEEMLSAYPIRLRWLTDQEARDSQLIDPEFETDFMDRMVDSDDSGISIILTTDTSHNTKGQLYYELYNAWLDGKGKVDDLFDEPVDLEFLEERGLGQFVVHSIAGVLEYELAVPLEDQLTKLRNTESKADILRSVSYATLNTLASTVAAFMCGAVVIASRNSLIDAGAFASAGVVMAATATSLTALTRQVKTYFDGIDERAEEVASKAQSMEWQVMLDIHGAYCLTHTSAAVDRMLLAGPTPEIPRKKH